MAPITDNKSSFNGFASQNYTWAHNLDHIYYRNAVPQYFETHDKRTYGVPFLSDHFPIICDFLY
jgi:endonuclease/exonuclease/phosphatase (EEP) superfamily protein YafD